MVNKDAVLVGAVNQALAAAIEAAGEDAYVGNHLGFELEGERVGTHKFAANVPGYPHWFWAVTVARAPRARVATISEVELLPGTDALLAPAWVPWADRIRPGDIGPGDVLPFQANDPRLQPGWQPTTNDLEQAPAISELAIARARVLNADGRAAAAQRWYRGKQGPTSAGAIKASAACSTCAFSLPMAGSMGQMFAVCSNEWSPDDGQVVSLDHGCGAHSETDVSFRESQWPDSTQSQEELEFDEMIRGTDISPN
jgi:hypothetical protein